ncbi:MAG: transglutaminase-like domain-containing protein, partial [Thermofilaceae archaeon]
MAGFLQKTISTTIGSLQEMISTSYVPTVDDVAYARQLAEKLRGRDDADTLNNVLEWVEKNISYWRERALLWNRSRSRLSTLYLCVYVALIIIPPTVLLISLPSYSKDLQYLLVSKVVPVVVLALAFVFMIGRLLRSMFLKLARALFFALIMGTLLIILSKTGVLSQNSMFPQWVLELMGWFVVGASLFMLAYFLAVYSVFYVRDGGKNRLVKALALMDLTFQPSIPLREILRYRLAVCR